METLHAGVLMQRSKSEDSILLFPGHKLHIHYRRQNQHATNLFNALVKLWIKLGQKGICRQE